MKLAVQTPVSPDGKFVATGVMSLASDLNPDTVAIIDTKTDEVVAELPCPAGCHGINWGMKKEGGYYAYVTSQHANTLTIIDPDPNNDGDGSDAEIAGRVVLAEAGSDVTVGTGGQGILPLPLTSNGWIQDTVDACDSGQCSEEVSSWIEKLTDKQKDPS